MKRTKEDITEIILHCSATIEGKDYSNATITRWHIARGFRTIGYHFVIGLDGEVRKGRNILTVGAHCKGRNKNTIGICIIGGLDKDRKPKDTRTLFQKHAIKNLIIKLKKKYPNIKKISGHYEYSNKACPCYNVDEYATL